jgi:hypothetical protein
MTILGRKSEMDPMNSIWYYTEFQRQRQSVKRSWQDVGETSTCPAEPLNPAGFRKPDLGPGGSTRDWFVELGLPVFVFAAVIGFGLLCYLFPTFLP